MDRSVWLRISLTLCAVFLCGAIINSFLASHHSAILLGQGCEAEDVLLVTNNDGYYHLAKALEIASLPLSEFFTASNESLLLAGLLSIIGGTDMQSLLSVGGCIGPILGLTMLLAVFPWCVETRSLPIMFFAPLLALLAPFWLERTHVGVLDTDVLVPCLTYLALYCITKFSTMEKWRWVWLIPYFLISLLFWGWWKPGAFVCIGFLGCYLLHWPRRQGDFIGKLLLLIVAVGLVILAFNGVQPFARYGEYIAAHIRLVLGDSSNALVNKAILELGGVSLAGLGERSLGSLWLLALVPLGGIAYGIHYRWKSLFLLVSALVFGIASLLSERFVIFFIPAASFLATYFMVTLSKMGSQYFSDCLPVKKNVAYGALICVAIPALLWGAVSNTWRYKPKSYFTGADYALAQTVKQTFPAEALIWTWWDYGYFFRFFSGMEVLFDGGSQTNRTCFIASYPLMQGDLKTANRWMTLFSDNKNGRLNLAKRGSEWSGYLAEYVDSVVLKSSSSRPVALCLPARVYTTVGYLYSFAHVFDESIPPVTNHLDLFPKEGFQYDPDTGVVVVPEVVVVKGYEGFGSVLNVSGKTPGQLDFKTLPEPYLVYSDNTDLLAVTDTAVVKSVLFRLLGLFDGDASLFEPITFDYRTGGVWRVR